MVWIGGREGEVVERCSKAEARRWIRTVPSQKRDGFSGECERGSQREGENEQSFPPLNDRAK